MVNIIKSSLEEIKDFNEKEWVFADQKYYGEGNGWKEEEFVFKAEEYGQIVGSISGKFEEGVLYIGDLIVAKDKREKGIGKMLLEKAEEFGKNMGAHKSYLITGEDWDVRKFYEDLGYKNTGGFKNHFRHVNFVVYEKLF